MEHSRKVGFAIKAISNEFMRFMDNQIRDDGITGMHYGVLRFISRHEEDVYQRDVEKEFKIRRSTATGILQLMEKKGLIRREDVEHDARLKKLVVTEKALAFERNVEHEITQIEKQVTKGITDEELDTFFGVLNKISKNIS